MNSRENRLIDSVESLLPEIMRFTRDLVAQPSTLGNETGVLEVMAAELETLGFASSTKGRDGFTVGGPAT